LFVSCSRAIEFAEIFLRRLCPGQETQQSFFLTAPELLFRVETCQELQARLVWCRRKEVIYLGGFLWCGAACCQAANCRKGPDPIHQPFFSSLHMLRSLCLAGAGG